MTDRKRRPSMLLMFSLALNVAAFCWLSGCLQERNHQKREMNAMQQTETTLYRVLPKTFYTRNEFALAVALPGAVPEIHDCLVQFGEDVFVFDTTNRIIGMYEAGPNPFVPDWPSQAGWANFKCDRQLPEDHARRLSDGAADWDPRMEGARRHLMNLLKDSDPSWAPRQAR